MEVPGPFGGLLGSRRVNPSADLDEETLRFIAQSTGGRYFRARDRGELEGIYAELDRLEPVEQAEESRRPMDSLAHWPLGAAFLTTIALALASLRRAGERLPAGDGA